MKPGTFGLQGPPKINPMQSCEICLCSGHRNATNDTQVVSNGNLFPIECTTLDQSPLVTILCREYCAIWDATSAVYLLIADVPVGSVDSG